MNYRNPVEEFRGQSPVELHYTYGVNCYQHAIGLPTPFLEMAPVPSRADLKAVHYLVINPGNMDEDQLNGFKGKTFKQYLFDACEMDGIIVTENRFEQREGYRTLAIFSTSPPAAEDYHFAYLNEDGKWEDKVPFRGVRKHANTSEIEKSSGYKFLSYALSPINIKPTSIKKFETTDLVLDDGRESVTIKLVKRITNEGGVCSGNEMLFNSDQNVAFLIKLKALIPLPYMGEKAPKPERQFNF